MAIPFIKMQGLGNDFVVIDDLGKPHALCQPINAELAKRICDRRFGIGADQLLWLKTPLDAQSDARMEILNSDGSVAEMCGNGIRAIAIYLYRHGPKRKPSYAVETLAGLKHVEIHEDGGVSVDMGAPELGQGLKSSNASNLVGGAGPGPLGPNTFDQSGPGEKISAGGQQLKFFEVDMGNPHAVFFVDRLEGCDIERLGPLLESHERFPKRTNVEFVEVVDSNTIRVRVWERGAGLTLACGTGACASAVAALATGRAQGEVEVRLPGGSLWVLWDAGGPVRMEGPAEEVFRGEWFI